MSADKYPSIFSGQMATIVYIYHDGLANENSRIALSNDPVFNNTIYVSGFLKKVLKNIEVAPRAGGVFFAKGDDIKIKGKSVLFSFVYPFLCLSLSSFLYFLPFYMA